VTYRVVWTNRAFDVTRLAFFRAWEMGGDHAAIDRALADLNGQLATDPLTFGESRDGNERIGFQRPLVVQFEPYPARGVVIVYDAYVRT
jgi:hypothetical protein